MVTINNLKFEIETKVTDHDKDITKTAEKTSVDYSQEQLEEWEDIEELVMEYKKQFTTDDQYQKIKSQDAAAKLIEKFSPLIKKYISLIKTGKIDFDDAEMKQFVLTFMDEPELKRALRRKKQSAKFRYPILQKFNFIKETYGFLAEEDIQIDLQMLFLILMKRYKQVGRNFCAYVYNVYCYEVSRHIKKFISNPANIHYRGQEYVDFMQVYEEKSIETCFEDKIYENNIGIPDITWISGQSCSDEFLGLSNLERKLIIKYYLEDYNDRQIATEFGLHINTVNLKRRRALVKLCNSLNIDPNEIKRNRKSGKKALYYTKLQLK